jgi:hypothetical protein
MKKKVCLEVGLTWRKSKNEKFLVRLLGSFGRDVEVVGRLGAVKSVEDEKLSWRIWSFYEVKLKEK